MKKVLVLFVVLALVVITGVLISEASGTGISRTQEMSVSGATPVPSPDPVPEPKPDPYAPTPWNTAVSNPNYEARLEYINGLWYGELRDKRTGEIVLFVPLPDGNNTHSWDVSPDGSTVFYDLGDTVYAQRVAKPNASVSMKGKLKSISFDGQYATVNVSNPDGSFAVMKVNLVTGEAVQLGTGVDGPKPYPDPIANDPGTGIDGPKQPNPGPVVNPRGTGIDNPLPPME